MRADVLCLQKHRGDEKKKSSSDSYKNKSLFKDKKLNNLWEKAEMAGFTSEELSALKEEFNHHQDKVDVYYSLLDDVSKNVPKKNHESKFSFIHFLSTEMFYSTRCHKRG